MRCTTCPSHTLQSVPELLSGVAGTVVTIHYRSARQRSIYNKLLYALRSEPEVVLELG